MVFQRLMYGLIGLAVLLISSQAVAADFTQPEHDGEFKRTARRQDKKLNFYFGDMLPADWSFNHLGGFSVSLHREGLERSLRLVPVDSVPYPDIESFRAAARKERQVVGYISLTYGQANDNTIIPAGTHLLTYDGLHLEVYDVHNFMLTEQNCRLAMAPNGFSPDPILGTLEDSSHSLAGIAPDGSITIAIQLGDEDFKPLVVDGVHQKFIVSGEFPGIATDDDTPVRELVTPKDEDEDE